MRIGARDARTSRRRLRANIALRTRNQHACPNPSARATDPGSGTSTSRPGPSLAPRRFKNAKCSPAKNADSPPMTRPNASRTHRMIFGKVGLVCGLSVPDLGGRVVLARAAH